MIISVLSDSYCNLKKSSEKGILLKYRTLNKHDGMDDSLFESVYKVKRKGMCRTPGGKIYVVLRITEKFLDVLKNLSHGG